MFMFMMVNELHRLTFSGKGKVSASEYQLENNGHYYAAANLAKIP